MFVTHGADLHASLPLPVALVEELVHDAVGPLAVQIQGLGGVAQVRTVNHVPQHLEGGQRTRVSPLCGSVYVLCVTVLVCVYNCL